MHRSPTSRRLHYLFSMATLWKSVVNASLLRPPLYYMLSFTGEKGLPEVCKIRRFLGVVL